MRYINLLTYLLTYLRQLKSFFLMRADEDAQTYKVRDGTDHPTKKRQNQGSRSNRPRYHVSSRSGAVLVAQTAIRFLTLPRRAGLRRCRTHRRASALLAT